MHIGIAEKPGHLSHDFRQSHILLKIFFEQLTDAYVACGFLAKKQAIHCA